MDLETQKLPASYKTYAFLLLFVSTLTLYLLYMQSYAQLSQSNLLATVEYPGHAEAQYLPAATNNSLSQEHLKNTTNTASQYLVWSSKCRIPNIKPFNEDVKSLYSPKSYTSCTKQPLLTYTEINDNRAVLYINETAIPSYSKNGVSCCYSSVARNPSKKSPDDKIKISSCAAFEEAAELAENEDVVLVKCQNNVTKKEIYKNVHAVVTITSEVQKKIEIFSNSKQKHLNILCIGIDSVSRLNLMRAMPKTHAFLKDNHWLELKGYNKVADNTFPNLMAILTGMNQSTAYEVCNPTKLGYLDECEMVWYDYRDLGYVTGYAEDEGSINTFNFNKKGFIKPPTDYYFRPYVLGAENQLKTSKVDEMTYCTGPETSGERIFHLIKQFSSTFKEHPHFGFFWMNTFSHNKLHAVSRMDRKVLDFLKDLTTNDTLKDTIVIFFSDHGLRFGNIRYTRTGWLEERLPFFYMSFPKWFEEEYPEEYKNVLLNLNRLITPYDIYMTLQDVLIITNRNYTTKPSSACPNCKSIFRKIPSDRSCEEAAIEQHWCTCSGYTKISSKNSTVEAASRFILRKIHKEIDSYKEQSHKCAKYKFKKVISASVSENGENWYKNDTYLLIILETVPEAVFEATVSVILNPDNFNFQLSGSISRLDYYKTHSHCVHDSILKKYCHCHT